jgi:hypothetical protein
LCCYSQNYVYVGVSPIFNVLNLNPYLDETKKIVTNKLDSVWNQNSFRLSNKQSALFTFGYKKTYKRNLTLGIGGEIGVSRIGINQYGNEVNDVGIFTFGIPISFQKKFVINERLNFYTSVAIGINSSFGTERKTFIGVLGGYTTEIYQLPNSMADTVNISYSYEYGIGTYAGMTFFARPMTGLQYIFKNLSYVELGIGYNFSLQKNYFLESTVNYSYASKNDNFGGYKSITSRSFSMPYLLAEIKYCIPLALGRIN